MYDKKNSIVNFTRALKILVKTNQTEKKVDTSFNIDINSESTKDQEPSLAVTDADSSEILPAMIDSVGKGPMIDYSPNAIKIRNSVEHLSHKPFTKLSEKDIEKHKNMPSTIKNPDGTYTAKTNLNGFGCITFDEEGNILYKTSISEIYGANRSFSSNYVREVTYDGCGRLLAETMHDGTTVTYEYNDDGTYTKSVMKYIGSIKEETTTYRYKTDGELISQESQSGVDEQKIKKAHAHTHSDGSYTIPGVALSGVKADASLLYGIDKMTLYDCNEKPILQICPAFTFTHWRSHLSENKAELKKCEEFDDNGRPLRYTSSNGSVYEYKYDDENGKVTGTLTRKDGYVYQNYSRSSIESFLNEHM